MPDIISIVDKDLVKVIERKNEDQQELKANALKFKNTEWRGMSVQKAMFLFMFGLVESGMYENDVAGFYGKAPRGTLLSVNEDKLRLTGVQKTVTNAFSSKLTDLQEAFNRAKSDPSVTTGELRSIIGEINAGLAHLQAVAGKDSPFDAASAATIKTSSQKLLAILDQVDKSEAQGGYNGSLHLLYEKATLPGNVGAASLIKDVNDQCSAENTTFGSISSATNTQITMLQKFEQQWLALLKDLMQAPSTLIGATLKGQQ